MRSEIPIGPRAVLLLLILLALVMYATGWLGEVTSGLIGGSRVSEETAFQSGPAGGDMVTGHVRGAETAEGTRRRWLDAGQHVVVRYSLTRERGRVRLAVSPVSPEWNPLWTVMLESSARDTVVITAPSAGNYELLVRRTEFAGSYTVSW